MLKKLLILLFFLSTSMLSAMDVSPAHLDSKSLDVAACLEACKRGDVAQATWFFEKGGVDPKRILDKKLAKHVKNTTFLHWSVEHPEIVQLLLDKHVLVDVPDHDNWTPLSWAADRLQPETVEKLLAHNASPVFAAQSGVTPLHIITWGAAMGFRKTTYCKEKILTIIDLLKEVALRPESHISTLLNRALETPIQHAALCKDPDILLHVLLPSGMPARLEKESRARVLTLLCSKKRLRLPQEIILNILAHLAVDCQHAHTQWVVPSYIDIERFSHRYVQEIIPAIKETMCPEEYNALKTALAFPYKQGEIAKNHIANVLLDPAAWK